MQLLLLRPSGLSESCDEVCEQAAACSASWVVGAVRDVCVHPAAASAIHVLQRWGEAMRWMASPQDLSLDGAAFRPLKRLRGQESWGD
jgi:hypothetical protein